MYVSMFLLICCYYMIYIQHKDTQFILRMQRGKCNNGSELCAQNDERWAQVVSVSILRCSLVPARYQGCSLINFHCYSSDLTLVHVEGCQVDVDSGVAFIRSYRKFFRYLIHYKQKMKIKSISCFILRQNHLSSTKCYSYFAGQQG